jgi:hypothetical protein
MNSKIAASLFVLALAANSAPAQQTGTLIGRTPGSAANSGLRAVRVIPPPPTCGPSRVISTDSSTELHLPDLVFSRMDLICVRHSDGRFEALSRLDAGVLSPDATQLAYWNPQHHELHVRSLADGSDKILDALPDFTPKELHWSDQGHALIYPVNNENPLRYRVLDLDSGKRFIVERGPTRILGAPDPAHLLAIGQDTVERITVFNGKHETLATVPSPNDAQYSPSGKLLGILIPGPGGREAADDDTPDCTGGTFALNVEVLATKQLLEVPFPEGFDSVLDYSFSPAEDAVAVTFGRAGCDYPGDVARVYLVSLSNLALTPLSPADRMSVQAHWSPDGKTVIYSDYTGSDTPLLALDLLTRKATRLTYPGQNGPDTFLSWRPDHR